VLDHACQSIHHVLRDGYSEREPSQVVYERQ
jgi:hypothetical protein